MLASEKFIVRAQVLKLGPDQTLLAFAIAWIAKFALKLDAELQIVTLESAETALVANYEGVLLKVAGKNFVNSAVHKCIRLPEVAALLSGPLRDLAIGSGSSERLELLARYDALMTIAAILEVQGKTEIQEDIDPSLFVHESMEFHKWLMGLVSERLKEAPLAAWTT